MPHLWSPDGQSIAVGVNPAFGSDIAVPGGSDIYVMNADGSNMRSVTGDLSDNLLGWANDSQHLIYYGQKPGGASGSIFAVNIIDGTQIRLSGEIMDAMCAYWNCRTFVVRP